MTAACAAMAAAAIAVALVAGVLAALATRRAARRLDLVADAAHELRGPAAALSLAVTALRRDPAGAEWAARLEGQLDRLAAGLADLDAARAGRAAPPRRRTLPLELVVRAAVDAWRAPLAASGRAVELRWEAGPELVEADPGRLAQTLGNLLANACEHATGTVMVTVRRRGEEVVVEVADAGPAPAVRRRQPGRGRGLRIAARAARAAGGELTVRAVDSGLVATLALPRAALTARVDGGGDAESRGAVSVAR